MTTPDTRMQSIKWLGMCLRIPEDWEIVRHSVNPKAGTLIIVDRRRQRMQISWAGFASPPDENRIFEDLRSRDLKDNTGCKLSDIVRCGQFGCYRSTDGTTSLTRAGLYDRRLNRWVDIVIPWHDGPDDELERQILDSYHSERISGKGLRWQVFKLDFVSPPEWKMSRTEVLPARVTMHFECGRAHARVVRIGAADTWFDGHLENFLRRQIDDAEGKYLVRIYRGHEACMFSGRERSFRLRWLTGNRLIRTDMAWHCPSCHAVYQIVTEGNTKTHRQPDTFQVICCESGKTA